MTLWPAPIGRVPTGVVCALLLASVSGCGPDGGTSDGSDRTDEDGRTVGVAGAPTPIFFEGARLFVGDGTVLEDGALLVSGGRIVAVGPVGSLEPDDDARRVDLSGRTVIPALIDAHAHLGYEGYTGWGADEYSRENLIDHLHRYAYYGFGAVLSAGSDPEDFALEIQRAQREGEFGGARFLFAAGMAPPDQGPNDRFLVQTRAVSEEVGVPVVRGLSTPADARRAVREVAERGIPFVKIWVDDRGGRQEKLAPPVYRAVMEEAWTRGLQVLVHQQDAGDMPDLIRSGADGFLHGRLGPALDREVASVLAQEGVFVVPNLGLGELRGVNVAADPFFREAVSPRVVARLDSAAAAGGVFSAGASPRASAGARDSAAETSSGNPPVASEQDRRRGAALSRLEDAGVPVVLGTDAGAVPDHFFGYAGHRELEILVRLGMTPTEALVAATSSAADALGLEEMGILAAGKSANFVILEADPRDEIRNTRTIVDVYLRGRRVDREGLREGWRGPADEPAEEAGAAGEVDGAPVVAEEGEAVREVGRRTARVAERTPEAKSRGVSARAADGPGEGIVGAQRDGKRRERVWRRRSR